jgi:hypothetical protein
MRHTGNQKLKKLNREQKTQMIADQQQPIISAPNKPHFHPHSNANPVNYAKANNGTKVEQVVVFG